MAPLTTVRVKHPDIKGEFMVINESDFDLKIHTRVADAPVAPPAPVAEKAKAPVTEPDAPLSEAVPPKAVSIVELTIAEATKLVNAATSVDQLDALQAAEAANKKAKKGRAKVLDAIEARRAALKA